MGVDNSKQLNSSNITDFSKLSRTLIKPIVNDELGREDHENAISMLNDSNYMFFYGFIHSLYSSDQINSPLLTFSFCSKVKLS